MMPRFSRHKDICVLLGVAFGVLGNGCGAVTSDSATSTSSNRDDSEIADDPNAVPTQAEVVTLTFADSAKNPIIALSRHTIDITVRPANAYHVKLALLGDSLDASLNKSAVITDDSGSTTVTLTASTTPTTFSIRALVENSLSTEFEVAVVDATTGTLTVTKEYGGTRSPKEYDLSLYSTDTCEKAVLSSTPPLQRLTVKPDDFPVKFAAVPIGTALAVRVDGDELTSGCTVVGAESGRSRLSALVTLVDRPIVLDDARLRVMLSTTPDATILASELTKRSESLLAAYQGAPHDLIALLDEMEDVALSAIQTEYVATRAASNWDTVVKTDDATFGGDSVLRTQLKKWYEPTLANLASYHALELTLALKPSTQQLPYAQLERIAGLLPEPCSLNSAATLSRSFDSTERLSWSTELTYNPTKLLECAIDTYAAESVPTASSTNSALATQFDCSTFASRLDARVIWTNLTARTCTVDCLASLCRSAIGVMYDRARAAIESTSTVTLYVSATGTVTLDETARPIATAGTWLGRYTTASNTQTVAGLFGEP